jgi:hypothetical protein
MRSSVRSPRIRAFAQDTIVRATEAVAKPEEISFADAATIPVAAATAYDATHQIELEAGQTLLILGAGGGVGLMAAQIGRVHQFTVIGIASETKRQIVESTGATFVPSGKGVADRVREVAPEGLDPSSTWSAGMPCARSPHWPPALAHHLRRRPRDGHRDRRLRPRAHQRGHGQDHRGHRVRPRRPPRHRPLPLEQAGEAIVAVETGHTTGKTVIEPYSA